MALRLKVKVEVSNGFIILMALLFWLDEGVGLLFPALIAAALHELGHVAAILLAQGSIKGINLTAVGAEMELDGPSRFSYHKDLLVALAGPLASFLCAWVAFALDCYLLAAMCAGQGAFNLLPVGPLDGGRVMYAILAQTLDDRRAEWILSAVSLLVVGGLFGLGLILLRKYGNPTLAITSGWLMLGNFRQKE